MKNIMQTKKFHKLNDKKENEKLIKTSDLLLNNTFIFDKVWDMERCLIPINLGDDIDWNFVGNDDEEWTFMLNRMGYLDTLILSFIYTKEEKYALKAKYFILDWIKKHEEIKYSYSTRTLDTGIRVLNIYECACYLSKYNFIGEKEIQTIIDSIKKQINYMKENYVVKYTLSNWGIIQVCSILCVLPAIYDEYKNNEIYTWASQELLKQVDIQIYDDGSHWEKSTLYHCEVLNYLLYFIYYSKQFRIKINEKVINKTISMVDALYLIKLPDNTIEPLGDSDKVISNDIFIKANILFNTKRWGVFKEDIDYDTLYKFNVTKQNYDSLNPLKTLNYDGTEIGVFVTKSDKSKKASYTMFTNSSLTSGHGHCDNLHLSIGYKGNSILIDSGRYTYREDHYLRMYFKSMHAHNIPFIENDMHSIPDTSWTNSMMCNPLKTYFKHQDDIHYYESAVYSKELSSFISRKLLVIEKGIWVILDEFVKKSNHTAVVQMHFHPSIQINGNLIIGKENLKIISEDKLEVIKTQCSLKYNDLQNNNKLLIKKEFKDNCFILHSIIEESINVKDIDVYQGNKLVKDKDLLIAKQFIINNELNYVVVLFTKEVVIGNKIFRCNDTMFQGKSLIIKQEKLSKEIVYLKR